jgi:hypothetical protein
LAMKIKTITVTLTDEEVDTLEDMLWCQMTDEQLAQNKQHRDSLWRKIASEFDKEPKKRSLFGKELKER